MTVNLKTCEYSIPKTIWGKAGGMLDYTSTNQMPSKHGVFISYRL